MMNKRTLFSTLSLVLIIGLVVFPIFGLSKTRHEYVEDFLYSAQDDLYGAFSEGYNEPDDDSDVETVESTCAAIIALNLLDAINLDLFTATDTWAYDHVSNAIVYNNLQNLSDTLEALYYLDEVDPVNLFEDFEQEEEVMEFCDNRSVYFGDALGYSFYVGQTPTIYDTYLVVKAYYYLGVTENLEVSNITEYIMNSYSVEGGFKSLPTGSEISLTSTFYAIQTLAYLDSLDVLTDKSSIQNYVNQFYVDDSVLEAHYGGYYYNISDEITFTTISATFEAVRILTLLDYSVPDIDVTSRWLLSNQNIMDGGFAENTLEGQESISSTITTFQAVHILHDLGQLDLLSEEFGDYKLRWWIVLIIVLVVLAGGITGIILYQRRIKL
jgi:prenyltransferase beta subunit